MSRYYTPKIEEFNVGFEFESNYVLFNNSGSEEWKKIIMSGEEFEWFHSAYEQDAYSTEFRVKYLDKKDIESLGFKQSVLDKSIYIFKDKVSILPHLPKTTIGINFNEGINHLLIFNVPDEEKIPAGVNIFVGQIKNKSELKRLLNQLNII